MGTNEGRYRLIALVAAMAPEKRRADAMTGPQGPSEFQHYNAQVRERWDRIAPFWDGQMGDDGNVFHQKLIGPAQERLLGLDRDDLVLEIACGNGQFTRRMVQLGARVLAADVSERVLDAARARATADAGQADYRLVDATDPRQLLALGAGRFDAAVCTMALFDMASIGPLFDSLGQLLKPGGRFVFSLLHPCFNSPPDMQMLAEKDFSGGVSTKYSVKLSRYVTPTAYETVAIDGQPVSQWLFHRPLSVVLAAGFRAGFVVDGLEEPVFDDSAPPSGTISWDDLREVPPVMVIRMRLSTGS